MNSKEAAAVNEAREKALKFIACVDRGVSPALIEWAGSELQSELRHMSRVFSDAVADRLEANIYGGARWRPRIGGKP